MSSLFSSQESPVQKLGSILVVDDETELTAALCEMLSKQGYETTGFSNGLAALAALQARSFDVLLADLMMPEMDGITLLKKALEIDSNLVCIVMTGQGTVQTAVEAMKSGAFDYLLKPFKLNSVLTSLSRSLEIRQLRTENIQLRELLNIYELGQVVALTLDLDVVFQKATETILHQCQADEVSILLPVENENEMEIASAYGAEREHLIGKRIPVEGTITGWVARHLETLTLEGEVIDSRFTPAYPRPDICAAISMPLVSANELVGVINVNLTRQRCTLTPGQIRGLSILASIVASAMENARLFDAVQQELMARNQRERELQAIAKVSLALRSAVTRSDMLPVILDEVSELMEAEGVALVLRAERSGEMIIEGARGEWSSRTGEQIPEDEELTRLVIQTGRPYPELWPEQGAVLPEWMAGLPAAVCAPLIAQGTALGALWVARRKNFSEAEIRLLTSISDIAANSIQRGSLYEQTEERLRRLSALRTIDLAISSSLDLRVTLNILLDQVYSQLAADAAAILLLDPQAQTLEYAAGRGFHSNIFARSPVLLGVGHAGVAALERRTVQVRDLAEVEPGLIQDSLISAEDLRSCCATPLIAKGEVKGVLEVFHRSPFTPDAEWLEFFEALAGQAAIALDSAQLFDSLQRSNQQLMLAYNATIEGWSHALDLRDKETEGHTRRVTEMALRLARSLGAFDETDLVHIRRGALLHDIGKMGVPDEILHKPGELTDEEWAVMRRHPVYAYQLLAPIPYLRKALDIPYYHHEKWDGSGYPQGIMGEQIPLAARIFSVVDVWDALRSDRPYRPGWPDSKVVEYIRSRSGTDFDPRIVEAFLKILAEQSEPD